LPKHHQSDGIGFPHNPDSEGFPGHAPWPENPSPPPTKGLMWPPGSELSLLWLEDLSGDLSPILKEYET